MHVNLNLTCMAKLKAVTHRFHTFNMMLSQNTYTFTLEPFRGEAATIAKINK